MAARLYALAAETAALRGGETVYDLYCGIGAIGLSLARDALTVAGKLADVSLPIALALSLVYPLILLPLGFYLPAERRRLRRLISRPA